MHTPVIYKWVIPVNSVLESSDVNEKINILYRWSSKHTVFKYNQFVKSILLFYIISKNSILSMTFKNVISMFENLQPHLFKKLF